ncbi:MAG: glycogen debranching enzyme GlgX [Alphaproteobacteria bacterium TMED89]|nr:glycogen debranching enzyme GlgX [Rhodospirillaceae bacterium]RPH16821.1 MAG: glycogen debranching enzyme GlgX [Alphaproteobacteria bacterium TMED89]
MRRCTVACCELVAVLNQPEPTPPLIPPGLSASEHGFTARLFSAHAQTVWLCVFDGDDLSTETHRFPLHRETAGWWCGSWSWDDRLRSGFAYGFRVDGPYDPAAGHRFNKHKLLADPYARSLRGELISDPALYGFTNFDTGEGFSTLDSAPFVPKAWFDPSAAATAAPRWQRPLTRWRDTVIYEAHLKGFSKAHPALNPSRQGTYQAYHGDSVLVAYLADLGVTAVEFLPLAAFADERHLAPLGLTNHWGYNPLHFFVPTERYNQTGDDPITAVQTMVAGFHSAGLEVLLDVVFNHTAESDHLGPTLSFRGIDNASYYHLDPSNPARYQNPTGTGNALNSGHPVVQRLVLDALAYWHDVLGMDGFRFDLASTLARDESGRMMQDPALSLTGLIDRDPRLGRAKLIAEPWDMGEAGYQLGRFGGRWTEWNDRFRDGARALWHPAHRRGGLQAFADQLLGSARTFEQPLQSINFLTAHDGFTLADLTSFDQKHNWANGEQNRDGHNHNLSWNHGAEGPTTDPETLAERNRTARALLLTLLLSQGVPMLSMGDERGHSQHGNNNAYCQDTPLSWLDWRATDSVEGQDLTAFVRQALELVRRLPVLREARHLHRREHVSWWRPDGVEMTVADWQDEGLEALVVQLPSLTASQGPSAAVALNTGEQDLAFSLPEGEHWTLALGSVEAGSNTCLPRRSVLLFHGVDAPQR